MFDEFINKQFRNSSKKEFIQEKWGKLKKLFQKDKFNKNEALKFVRSLRNQKKPKEKTEGNICKPIIYNKLKIQDVASHVSKEKI